MGQVVSVVWQASVEAGAWMGGVIRLLESRVLAISDKNPPKREGRT